MFSTILKDTYNFYLQNFSYFAAIILPLVIPVEALNVIAQTVMGPDFTELSRALPYILVSLLVYPVYHGALILAVKSRLDGKTEAVKTLWTQGYSFWSTIVVANILYYVIVTFGILLLIIPGIFFAIRFALFEQNAVLNQEGPIEALKSSWEDTSDQFWLVLNCLAVLVLIIIMPAYLITLWVATVTNGSLIALFVTSVLQSLLYPIFVILLIRIRHYIKHNE